MNISKKSRIRNFWIVALLMWFTSVVAEVKMPITEIPKDSYQVIITNNLFSLLGWTKQKFNPNFELVATAIKRNGKHKALIRSLKGP